MSDAWDIADKLATEVKIALGWVATVRGAILDGMRSAVAAEREACAKLAEEELLVLDMPDTEKRSPIAVMLKTRSMVAAAIRARGKERP